MLSRTRQTLVAVVAVFILCLLWFVGNEKSDPVPADPAADTVAEIRELIDRKRHA